MNNKNLIQLLIIFLLIYLIYYIYKKNFDIDYKELFIDENFKIEYTNYIINQVENINYYPVKSPENSDIELFVISLKHDNRLISIDEQRKKINKYITIFDAVKGDNLILQKLVEKNILNKTYVEEGRFRLREIGCYMSHLILYNFIKKNMNKNDYTIIFEDDFNIVEKDLVKKTNDTIKKLNKLKLDFDILYLGNNQANHGTNIKDDIYNVDQGWVLWGTHGYLIKNKNIDKIIDGTKLISAPIDVTLQNLGKDNKLNIYVLYPTIVNQNFGLGSTITNIYMDI